MKYKNIHREASSQVGRHPGEDQIYEHEGD